MKLFVVYTVLAVFCSAALASPIDFESRIVGGTEASEGQFPYQISLRTQHNGHFCGGWVHNERWVVSVAHCTLGRIPENVRVVVAAHTIRDGTTYETSRIVNHPNYDGSVFANDISCVQTAVPITMNARVQPIPMGQAVIGGNVPTVISGWGQTGFPGTVSTELLFMNTVTLSNEDCAERHTVNGFMIFDSKICTLSPPGHGVCMGDSGGPVVAGGSVIGSVSWVIPCAHGIPDVHARVSYHRPWLIQNMV